MTGPSTLSLRWRYMGQQGWTEISAQADNSQSFDDRNYLQHAAGYEDMFGRSIFSETL